MSIHFFTQINSSSSGGYYPSNASTLDKLSTDSNGNLLFNGKLIVSNSIEVAHSITITQQEVSQKFLELSGDCDTSKIITLALNGIALEQGEYWNVDEKKAPSKDLIVWSGLELERLIQTGDKILISYYKKV